MRSRALLLFLLPFLLLPLACGDDGGGDDTPAAGAAGAFGEADDCAQLVDQTLAARAEVLDQLGEARRTDTERIDAALSSFGQGPDLSQRYQGLGCGADFDDAVCAAAGDLQGQGPAARDLVATWAAAC